MRLFKQANAGTFGNIFLVIALVLFCLILYIPSLSYYFAQDDFFFLNKAANHAPGDLASMFKPFGPFYRPLTTTIYFAVMLDIFDLRPVAYHVISIGLFSINVLLVYLVCWILFQNQMMGFITAVFYLTRGVHFETVSWASGIQDLMMVCFVLMSLVFYLKFAHENRKHIFIISLVFFVLAILSKETAFVLPFLLCTYEIILNNGRMNNKKYIPVAAFFSVTAIFFLLRFLYLQNPPESGEYAVGFGIFWISNLMKYFMVTINIFFLIFSEFPQTLRYSTFVVPPVIIVLAAVIFFIQKKNLNTKILAVFRNLTNGGEERMRHALFGLIFFLFGALPALQFRSRFEPYYMSLAGVGISITLAAGLAAFSKTRIKVTIMVGVLIVSLILNAQIREKRLSHVGKFSPLARSAIESLRPLLEGNKRGATLYIQGADNYLWFALAQGDAVKTFFPGVESVIFDHRSPGYQRDGSEIVFRYKGESQTTAY